MTNSEFADFLAGAFAVMILVLAFVAGVGVFLMRPAEGREQYPGQYAQVDPGTQKWFREQMVPGTRVSCCSEADGVYAGEDIRAGHYWVRFVAKQYNDGAPVAELDSGWMQVPDEVVIREPNINGHPIVWWGWKSGLTIRCYAPGPLM